MDNFISSFIRISNNLVSLNGAPFFRGSAGEEFEGFIKQVYKSLGITYSTFYKMDNLSKLGFIAAEILLNTEKKIGFAPEKTGIFFQNSSSSLDTDFTYFNTIKDKENYFPSPAVFVYTLPNIVIGEICIRNKIKGENSFFIAETFDPEFMEAYVEELFAHELIEYALCGWVELFEGNYEAFLYFVRSGKKLSENSSVKAKLHSTETLKKIFTE